MPPPKCRPQPWSGNSHRPERPTHGWSGRRRVTTPRGPSHDDKRKPAPQGLARWKIEWTTPFSSHCRLRCCGWIPPPRTLLHQTGSAAAVSPQRPPPPRTWPIRQAPQNDHGTAKSDNIVAIDVGLVKKCSRSKRLRRTGTQQAGNSRESTRVTGFPGTR
jgi:hypothetical protein